MQDRQGGTPAGSPSIRSTGPTDRDWITQFLYDRWAADFVVVHGEVIKPADLPALTYGQGEGLATYRLLGEDAELVTLDAIPAGSGIGTALVAEPDEGRGQGFAITAGSREGIFSFSNYRRNPAGPDPRRRDGRVQLYLRQSDP